MPPKDWSSRTLPFRTCRGAGSEHDHIITVVPDCLDSHDRLAVGVLRDHLAAHIVLADARDDLRRGRPFRLHRSRNPLQAGTVVIPIRLTLSGARPDTTVGACPDSDR